MGPKLQPRYIATRCCETVEVEPEVQGLLYFRARYYDPATGRFVQRDPVWDPGNFGNQYSFVGNSPASGRDPYGDQGIVDQTLDFFNRGKGSEVLNVLSFGALKRQQKLVKLKKSGKISSSEYWGGTVLNAANSASNLVPAARAAKKVLDASKKAKRKLSMRMRHRTIGN